METSMPRWRAERMAERTGGEVMFGLWILMVFSALESKVKMKALSGVGGAVTPSVDANGWNCGFRLWGEGRNTVGIAEMVEAFVVDEKCVTMFPCPRSEVSATSACHGFESSWVVSGKSGRGDCRNQNSS